METTAFPFGESDCKSESAPIRITIDGKHFYKTKEEALELAATILLTVKATIINE